LAAAGGEPSTVHSVAFFFVNRVDTDVDARLEATGTEEASDLRGRAAVAQAKLAYPPFRDRFSGPRWEGLLPSAPVANARCGCRRPRRTPPNLRPARLTA
jgi:hypothetical protein